MPFEWGEAVAGHLSSGSDVDSFEVHLNDCEGLAIDTAGIKGSGDTMLEVFAPELGHFTVSGEARKVLWNDDGGAEGGTNGKPDHVFLFAPLEGDYRIDVKSASGGAVDGYRLYLARERRLGSHCTHLVS